MPASWETPPTPAYALAACGLLASTPHLDMVVSGGEGPGWAHWAPRSPELHPGWPVLQEVGPESLPAEGSPYWINLKGSEPWRVN